MDLFKEAAKDLRDQPLAARMRPRNLDEFVGQEHIVGPGRLLRRAIQADQLSSLIFYGPPGTGKTTLAIVIASHTRSHFITVNAVLAGVAAIREAIEEAQRRRELHGQRSILFVDEVHRWNKAQQDALLPWVENGTIILVGATTENPFFEVNRALVSRSRIFQLVPLTEDEMRRVARCALTDKERGYGQHVVVMDEDALDHLVKVSSGDARNLLNALELAVETTPERFPPPPGTVIRITRSVAEESIQRRAVLYDKEGDYHFDTISAFIKSLRGSDPDAAVYWLAKMVYAGEDPRFLFRRMVIFAAEDVGLADPRAVMVAEANAAAFDRVGLPEGRFHLANTALYLATAPKSNSVFAFFDALKTVEKERDSDVPSHLRDSSRDAREFGHGEGYLYPHSYRGHWVAQQYLPDSLQGRVFYQPGDVGEEASIGLAVTRNREAQLGAMLQNAEKPAEILTVSPADTNQERWAARALSGQSQEVREIRERLFAPLSLRRHDLVLVLNAGSGYLVWECVRRVPEGGIWALVGDPDRAAILSGPPAPVDPARRDDVHRPTVLVGEIEALGGLLAERGQRDVRFEAILGANALARIVDRSAVIRALAGCLAPRGRLALAETVPRESQRLSELVAEELELASPLAQAEQLIYADSQDPRLGWTPADLERAARAAGLEDVSLESMNSTRQMRVSSADIDRWLAPDAPYGRVLGGQRETLRRGLAARLAGRPVAFRRRTCFLHVGLTESAAKG